MAQLSSPGVSVTVIDESFYTPAAAGTVPLIVVASAENKQNGAGTGTATGTLKANAGKVYLLTSQKDLADTFGTPVFKTDANNNPVHAGEQNEYGLQAAYSYLGVSNRAYVVRADADLAQLDASATPPAGAPEDGQYWFDVSSTKFGIFEWNGAAATVTGGQSFTNKVPTVITDATKVDPLTDGPKQSVGTIGSYAIVATTNENTLWYKKAKTDTVAGVWVQVGTNEWKGSRPAVQGAIANPTIQSSDTLIINGTTITGATNISGLVADINAGPDGNPDLDNNSALIAGVTAAVINGKLELYSTGVDIEISGTLAGALDSGLGLLSGTYPAPTLAIAPHFQVPAFKASADNAPTGSIWVKTTTANLGADWIVKKYSSATKGWTEKKAPLYANNAAALAGLDSTGGGLNLAVGALYVKYNDSEAITGSIKADFKIYARKSVGATTIKSAPITASTFGSSTYTFRMCESIKGTAGYTNNNNEIVGGGPNPTVTFTGSSSVDVDTKIAENIASIVAAINTAAGNAQVYDTTTSSWVSYTSGINVSVTSLNEIVITHVFGGDIKFIDDSGTPLVKLFGNPSSGTGTTNFYADSNNAPQNYVATLWISTVASTYLAPASTDAPTSIPEDGVLWYSSITDQVDIMINNGTTWVGYLDADAITINHAGISGAEDTDPAGPIVSASKPTKQSDGTALANGDLWVDTSDLENYPRLYKYNLLSKKWVLVDSSDQTTEDGILFHDARWNTNGMTADPALITDLLTSNFLDTDAPDPALYPKGMLLWNLRRSGFNVKRFVRDYVDTLARNTRFGGGAGDLMTDYYPHRWVSEAANKADGSGSFGRWAQRAVVVQKLQALVNSNQQIRDEESRIFNLIACPGYPELIGEMVSLNYDRGLTAFVVGDTPARLHADATTLSNWGFNTAGALEDNDKGLVSFDEYLGVFYPWGYSSDNIGNNIAVPPSHMMLRTIALNDNVSYPWFAPAGTRRGGITNATAVGYITAEGEFQSVALNTGQRDTLAGVKVNPITFITGTGLVNYGQYTRAKNASALDRINVARLVIYLRRQFAQLAKPYVFEPNDKITRDEIKGAAESLLLELVGQRALYDYIVVCDTSNNTPARIDRSELYLDVAIEPVKAVEFIYIPLRLKNTGEIKGLQ